jgi:integrase
MRSAGIRSTPPDRLPTLAEASESFLARKRISGKRGPLSPKGILYYEHSSRPWREGQFSSLPLDLLDRGSIEDAVLERASKHAVSARNELQILKAILLYAQGRGHRFDPALLTIEPVATPRHEKRALSADELEFLAAYAPSYAFRLVLLAGTTGNRINELFTLTDDRVDLANRTLTIPAELCKERRTKVIPLTEEETSLLREQLLARAPGTSLVFPKRHGSLWRYSAFQRLVWAPMLRDASRAWEKETETPSPFEGITCHDLRRTAVGLMRASQIPVELAAERLGQSDGGALLLQSYRVVRDGETRAALDGLGSGLRAATRSA